MAARDLPENESREFATARPASLSQNMESSDKKPARLRGTPTLPWKAACKPLLERSAGICGIRHPILAPYLSANCTRPNRKLPQLRKVTLGSESDPQETLVSDQPTTLSNLFGYIWRKQFTNCRISKVPKMAFDLFDRDATPRVNKPRQHLNQCAGNEMYCRIASPPRGSMSQVFADEVLDHFPKPHLYDMPAAPTKNRATQYFILVDMFDESAHKGEFVGGVFVGWRRLPFAEKRAQVIQAASQQFFLVLEMGVKRRSADIGAVTQILNRQLVPTTLRQER